MCHWGLRKKNRKQGRDAYGETHLLSLFWVAKLSIFLTCSWWTSQPGSEHPPTKSGYLGTWVLASLCRQEGHCHEILRPLQIVGPFFAVSVTHAGCGSHRSLNIEKNSSQSAFQELYRSALNSGQLQRDILSRNHKSGALDLKRKHPGLKRKLRNILFEIKSGL